MSERQQSQPFRFWFPYWNNPRPAPQRNPAAPRTRQKPLSRVPTTGARQQPQSTPVPQSTAAGAAPRRGAQPTTLSPSPSSSSSASASPKRTAAGSTSQRGAQPSPSASSSPSPSLSPSASQRSSRMQPDDKKAKQEPAIKPSSPSKGAAELPSPNVSSTSPSKSTIKPSNLESDSPIKKTPQTEEIKEEPSSSDSLQKDVNEKSEEKIFKPELETLKNQNLDEKLEVKTPGETKTDSKLKQHELDEKLRGILRERIRFDSKLKQDKKQEPIPEENHEPTKPEEKQEKNPTVALTPEMKTDFSELKHVGVTEQLHEKLDEKPRGIPEEKNKSDLEQKQDETPETNEKQKMKPIVKLTPDMKNELELEHVGTSQQEEKLDEEPRGIPEEKKPDFETRQHEKFEPGENQPMKPPIALTSRTETEDHKEENPQTELEIHDHKPHTSSSEEIGRNVEEQSIMVTDAKPASPHSTRGGESVSAGRFREQEEFQQVNVNGKEISQHESMGKTSKVSISSSPWASSYTGEQTNFPEEIRGGLSKLVQKLSIVHSNWARSDQAGVSIITLAGKNKGATMFIGNEGIKKHEKANVGETSDREKSDTKIDKDVPVAASVNSNVQSINNSVLNETKCEENSPGVHFVLSNKLSEEPVIPKGTIGPRQILKTGSNITTPQKLTYEPNIRRRCLRGLLMEPSEDDQEDPQKPRRHGCRVRCDGDKKKGKTDDGEATSKPNNQ